MSPTEPVASEHPAAHAPRKKRRRGPGGFSLIEIMMAASILAAGAAAVLGSYTTIMRLVEHQRKLVEAVNVTQGKLEELLSARTDSPLLSANGSERVDQLGRENPGGTYTVSWQLTEDRPAPGYLQIVVETSWRESGGVRITKFAAFRER